MLPPLTGGTVHYFLKHWGDGAVAALALVAFYNGYAISHKLLFFSFL